MAFLFLFKRRSVFYDGMKIKSEAKEQLKKHHCCKEKDNNYLCLEVLLLFLIFLCVQFNLAELLGLKPITILFLNTKFDVQKART